MNDFVAFFFRYLLSIYKYRYLKKSVCYNCFIIFSELSVKSKSLSQIKNLCKSRLKSVYLSFVLTRTYCNKFE